MVVLLWRAKNGDGFAFKSCLLRGSGSGGHKLPVAEVSVSLLFRCLGSDKDDRIVVLINK